jgi:hypothetical protein
MPSDYPFGIFKIFLTRIQDNVFWHVYLWTLASNTLKPQLISLVQYKEGVIIIASKSNSRHDIADNSSRHDIADNSSRHDIANNSSRHDIADNSSRHDIADNSSLSLKNNHWLSMLIFIWFNIVYGHCHLFFNKKVITSFCYHSNIISKYK